MFCPICKRPVEKHVEGRRRSYFPFCSERCKLIDLGRWLGGKYQIPVGRDGVGAAGRNPNDETRNPNE